MALGKRKGSGQKVASWVARRYFAFQNNESDDEILRSCPCRLLPIAAFPLGPGFGAFTLKNALVSPAREGGDPRPPGFLRVPKTLPAAPVRPCSLFVCFVIARSVPWCVAYWGDCASTGIALGHGS